MEQDQDGKSGERIEATGVQSLAVIGQNDGVVSHPHDPKNQKDHDRAQASQCGTEFEHVPGHRSSRSMHTRKTKTQKTKNQRTIQNPSVFLLSGFLFSVIPENEATILGMSYKFWVMFSK